MRHITPRLPPHPFKTVIAQKEMDTAGKLRTPQRMTEIDQLLRNGFFRSDHGNVIFPRTRFDFLKRDGGPGEGAGSTRWLATARCPPGTRRTGNKPHSPAAPRRASRSYTGADVRLFPGKEVFPLPESPTLIGNGAFAISASGRASCRSGRGSAGRRPWCPRNGLRSRSDLSADRFPAEVSRRF